ncbi:dihydrofolate reductase [Periweissella fabaria]|uniref:Dihydrofolate reductase n=1 Tax=Periweissella fabaria TaxID=546157 RepID=A0ABN8BDB6_9LACO|nr:dihydrofolate reductase [Periweissella fabaria]MCM0596519.1 dihydrofolate reductase [Periweissella fabaria]CAH0415752.1 Dihydrofolate reductase [Periweissella fabaria]
MINMVWAEAHDHVIAKDGNIPWRLPADLAFFKQETIGHPIVMGRNTFKTFNNRPLPQRTNIVLTHDENFVVPAGFVVMHSVAEVLAATVEQGLDLSVIGGVAIYDSFMPYADELAVTEVDLAVPGGDAQVAPVDVTTWQLVEERVGILDERNTIPHTFKIYRRK